MSKSAPPLIDTSWMQPSNLSNTIILEKLIWVEQDDKSDEIF